MTQLDDIELGRRLRALRVEPPESGFEARLDAQLLALEGTPEPAAGSRVIRGPWLRRGPVRLIGATALFLAGAAAAMEGGVVEWVQARVFQRSDSAPPAAPVEPMAPSPRTERVATRERAVAPALDTPSPSEPELLVPALSLTPRGAPVSDPAATAAALTPRVELERHATRGGHTAREAQGTREALDRRSLALPVNPRDGQAIQVPRVAIERHGAAGASLGEHRFERRSSGLEPPDSERRLDRLRDVVRQRRERGASERAERGQALDRVRERRDRITERRDAVHERERRERSGR